MFGRLRHRATGYENLVKRSIHIDLGTSINAAVSRNGMPTTSVLHLIKLAFSRDLGFCKCSNALLT